MESTITTIHDLIPSNTNDPSSCSTIIPKSEIKAEVKREVKTESKVDIDRILMPPPQKPISMDDFELEPTAVDLGKDFQTGHWAHPVRLIAYCIRCLLYNPFS